MEEQLEEIEALQAIFDTDFQDISRNPVCFMVKLSQPEHNLNGPLNLKLTLPLSYPSVKPSLEIPNRSGVLTPSQHASLLEHLESLAAESVGEVMGYTLVEAAQQWLTEMTPDDKDSTHNTEPETIPDVLKEEIKIPDVKISGGRWDYVIGLVGKPSAGKSTFFNAACIKSNAKVGAHPFTTLDPNIGRAFYAIPCPCADLELRCNAAYGHNFRAERLLPILIKDVAGLVPGACEGKGRGNSRWIYDNIMDKWDNIKKRPAKLVDMFTGYHTSKALIMSVLQRAGVDRTLANLPHWSEDVLHQIVDCFLDTRFPILNVLNKSDHPSAAENITRITQSLNSAVLPLSAKSECFLLELAESGAISYKPGDCDITLTGCPVLNAEQLKSVNDIQQGLFKEYASTNVHKALCEAVSLRPPLYAFPVQDLDNLTSIDKFKGESPGILRDCVSLLPGTTVEELYTTMLHYPTQLAAGDFIRAEATNPKTQQRWILKKDEAICEENRVLKVMTNRKVTPVKAKDSLALNSS
ncbi:hypothetical protein CAPTEDRAFT_219007 [Capitella teleta]|uniref:RWD domain-containing protein n=1 Tax=Capitella teleta TaxID=283909 RepID=R7UK08_CAPTE|nr:hypothetical protein CAPTEDRAFT_219007 [Capitella teleta]|eukprot:ELU06530.1 hypothetical protein CAPTEDRAFT_219007 [Capitella teleta]